MFFNKRNSQLFTGKTAVIFDFDGTIADTSPLHSRAFGDALAKYELQFDYKDYAGVSTNEAIQKIFEDNAREIPVQELELLVKQKRQYANDLYKKAITFMPGALAFIELLYSKKFRLYIGSSGSGMNIKTGLQSLGIERYFTGVITSDNVSKGKPDPAIFHCILNDFAVPAEEVLVIEDSPAGLLAAHAAGIDAVCVDKNITVDQVDILEFYCYDFFELRVFLEDESNK